VLVTVLFILNIVDAAVALAIVPTGLAEEINPLPKTLMNIGPYTMFLPVKVIVVSMALAWAWWRLRSGKAVTRAAKPVLIGTAMLLAFVIGIEIWALIG